MAQDTLVSAHRPLRTLPPTQPDHKDLTASYPLTGVPANDEQEVVWHSCGVLWGTPVVKVMSFTTAHSHIMHHANAAKDLSYSSSLQPSPLKDIMGMMGFLVLNPCPL